MNSNGYCLVKNFVKLNITTLLVLLIFGCSDKNTENSDFITTDSGLQYRILKKGIGTFAKKGDEVLIHETTSYINDSLVFSSKELPNPIKILVGGNQVIKGVDEGIQGMQKGEIRKLIVPPSLSKRIGNVTFPHPDSTLVYEIELIDIFAKKSIGPKILVENLAIDIEQSVINWTAFYALKLDKHFGTVKLSKGEWVITNGMPTGGKFYIDMSTIVNTDGKYNEMLIDHLKNEDFFEVEVYPIAKLEIVNMDNSKYPVVDIDADLTIKGIKQPISFSGKFGFENGVTLFTSQISINRTRWNIKYGSGSFYDNLGDDVISDDIEFNVLVYTR
ncbi:YceI family protein [Aquimarina gracilis]|uniref:peptidylprolyl isomerase n=1 Tax=Aquimarina gracilis TaxID=874422 RepID=A0ABU5ZXB2_9FLAO|nr:YceI family protein [Aquimarina gracilis]MEB3346504.1 YceI family protein [Aquimarina gracilis]